MSKQIIQIVWTPPDTVENFPSDEYKVKTEDGMVKLISEKHGIVRIFPATGVRLIQFITPEEKPTIIKPSDIAEMHRGTAQ